MILWCICWCSLVWNFIWHGVKVQVLQKKNLHNFLFTINVVHNVSNTCSNFVTRWNWTLDLIFDDKIYMRVRLIVYKYSILIMFLSQKMPTRSKDWTREPVPDCQIHQNCTSLRLRIPFIKAGVFFWQSPNAKTSRIMTSNCTSILLETRNSHGREEDPVQNMASCDARVRIF